MGSEPWKPVFLVALRDTMSVVHAAKAAGVGKSTLYDHRESDPEFAAAWDVAWRGVVVAELELSAMKRAVRGWLEPVFHQGQQVGVIRKFDNRLTWNMLQKWFPEQYGDKPPVVPPAGAFGVLVVPPGQDPASWMAQQAERNAEADRAREAKAKEADGDRAE